MTFVSYAQNFEDVILWRALRDVGQGRYIDIGAHDPEVDSVSLSFYKAGWRGLHVEPIPTYAARLREARPEEAVIEAAVTDAPGPILFYELSGLSSGRKDIADHHASCGHLSRQMFVPTVRLDELLKIIAAEVHWLKIDVEGMEADVLRSWGRCEIRPWVLVIESTFPTSEGLTHHLWIDEVRSRGYEQVFFDGLNGYFLHENHRELAPRFAAPPNVFDAFSVGIHHFSAVMIRQAVEQAEQRLAGMSARAEQLNADLLEARRTIGVVRHDHSLVLAQLAAAEESYRAAAEEAASREGQLRSEIGSTRVELARLEERSVQLQDKLNRADRSFQMLEERMIQAEQERNQARAQSENSLNDARAFKEEADRLGSRLVQADSLIRRAAAMKLGAWQRIGQALHLAPRRTAADTLAAWLPSTDAAVGSNDISQLASEEYLSTMPHAAQGKARNPYLRANSLTELLSWHDVEFVRCAYVTILGRQPDGEGEAYYVARLRSGHAKMEVLWQLRQSLEGAKHDPGIAGLDRALRRARRARLPLLGSLFRLFTHDEGDSAADRRERAIANDVGSLRAAHEAQMYKLQSHSSGLQRLERRLEAIEAGIATGLLPKGLGSNGSHNTTSGLVGQRDLLDPIDLSAAHTASEAIAILKTAINHSMEVEAFHSERRQKA